MDSYVMDVIGMSSISGLGSSTMWTPDKKASGEEKKASVSFSESLDELKNPGKKSGGGGEQDGETTTSIQRSVVSGPGGCQIVVLTQITTDANGKQIESKVVSRQKISSGGGQGQLLDEKLPADQQKSGKATDEMVAFTGISPAKRAEQEYEDHSVREDEIEGIFKANI